MGLTIRSHLSVYLFYVIGFFLAFVGKGGSLTLKKGKGVKSKFLVILWD